MPWPRPPPTRCPRRCGPSRGSPPMRRARLAAVPLAAALEVDPVFRLARGGPRAYAAMPDLAVRRGSRVPFAAGGAAGRRGRPRLPAAPGGLAGHRRRRPGDCWPTSCARPASVRRPASKVVPVRDDSVGPLRRGSRLKAELRGAAPVITTSCGGGWATPGTAPVRRRRPLEAMTATADRDRAAAEASAAVAAERRDRGSAAAGPARGCRAGADGRPHGCPRRTWLRRSPGSGCCWTRWSTRRPGCAVSWRVPPPALFVQATGCSRRPAGRTTLLPP